MTGMVDRIVRGQSYGFIRTTEDREVFFHRADVTHSSFNDLAAGDPVTFRLTDDIMTGPRATHVRRDLTACYERIEGKREGNRGTIERDIAALTTHGHDLRRESAELSRTAKELLRKAARLTQVLATQKPRYLGEAIERRTPFLFSATTRRTGSQHRRRQP